MILALLLEITLEHKQILVFPFYSWDILCSMFLLACYLRNRFGSKLGASTCCYFILLSFGICSRVMDFLGLVFYLSSFWLLALLTCHLPLPHHSSKLLSWHSRHRGHVSKLNFETCFLKNTSVLRWKKGSNFETMIF